MIQLNNCFQSQDTFILFLKLHNLIFLLAPSIRVHPNAFNGDDQSQTADWIHQPSSLLQLKSLETCLMYLKTPPPKLLYENNHPRLITWSQDKSTEQTDHSNFQHDYYHSNNGQQCVNHFVQRNWRQTYSFTSSSSPSTAGPPPSAATAAPTSISTW